MAVHSDLGAAHSHIVNHERYSRCTHWQPFKVAAHFGDIEQHFLQRRRNCKFADWRTHVSVLDQQSGSSCTEVTRNGVDPRMQTLHLLNQDAVIDTRDNLGLAPKAGNDLLRQATGTR